MHTTPPPSFPIASLVLEIIWLGIAVAWLKNNFDYEPALMVLTGIGAILSALSIWRAAQRLRSSPVTTTPEPEPAMKQAPAQVTAAQKTGERLRTVIDRLNETTPDGNGMSISRLAVLMALDRSGDLERYVAGEEEPTFEFLRRLAASVGANPEWLITGKGPIFPYPAHSMHNPMDCVPIVTSGKFQRVYFVRSKGLRGETVIMAQEGEFRYRLLNHPWTISGEVGAGGQETIRRFLEFLNVVKAFNGGHIFGGKMISAELFDRLVSGDAHPEVVLLAERTENPWWDDFCDIRHRMPIADKYGSWYGAPFIAAQSIAGSRP